MTNELLAAPPRRSRATIAAPWIGLAVAILLIVAAIAFPALSGLNVHVRSFPPLHAQWMPRIGPGTLPAIIVGLLSARYAVDLAVRLRWRMLLLASFASGVVWMVSLATVDGWSGLSHILDTQYEYLRTARSVIDIGALLHGYIARIPIDSAEHWPVHLAGHPPGAVLFFVVLVRLGLGSGLAAGWAVTVVAATTPVAVLIAMRRLGAERGARRAAPFLVFGPAAIWLSVSADAVFGAVAAWGLCALACAAITPSRWRTAAWAVLAGGLLGYCVMLSYGLPILGVLALAILLLSRRWAPLPWSVGAALVVVLGFAAAGFAWWDAYPVLVERYWAGVASSRPFTYWIWANLAALTISAGPLVGAGVAVAIRQVNGIRSASRGDLVAVVLTIAALVTVLAADLSGMSKAEVERIWLPFVPWLLLGIALLPERWRRWGLAGQLAFALVVQHLLATGW